MTDQTNPTPSGRDATCAGTKASLSAYLDDELSRAERLAVDAHLVGCTSCRRLVERAEALDASLRTRLAEDLADADSDRSLDDVDAAAMTGSVLAAIGAESRRRWRPRLAAAAAIAIVAGLGYLWSRSLGGDGLRPLAPAMPGEFARADVPTRPAPKGAGAPLTSDDRQALYATSIILDGARRVDFRDAERRQLLVETARYDELVERLNEVLPKLAPADRATVALARDATERLVDSSDDPESWRRVREDVEATSLDVSMDALSEE